LVQYVLGSRTLGDAGLYPAPAASPSAASRLRQQSALWGGATAAALVFFASGIYRGVIPVSAKTIADIAGSALIGGTVVFFVWLLLSRGWTTPERKRLYAITIF